MTAKLDKAAWPEVPTLLARCELDAQDRQVIGERASDLVSRIRAAGEPSFLDAFLAEYGLSNDEGVALLSMAEAYLRIPDVHTLDALVQEKLTGSDWQSHSGHAPSFLVNASTWALMLTGRLLSQREAGGLLDSMRGLLRRLGEPVVRRAMTEAMQRMGDHFVIGETIDQAWRRAGQKKHEGSDFSFDMLGEAAHTDADARDYLEAYREAIAHLGQTRGSDSVNRPGVSVKLSALHPRYEWLQRERSAPILRERLFSLAEQAAEAHLGLSIDAEELRRLDFSLSLFEDIAEALAGRNWQGLGLVVQAYSPYAPAVLEKLGELARRLNSRFPVRLVKGAYWDTEIKHAQSLGLRDYPVFTNKCDTDVSYLAAARQLLRMGERVYPQFATHNAHTMAAILHMAGQESHKEWEFQRLYGMGAQLHELIRKEEGTRHRIYAPVGEHEDLLAYLVRRLLENGANSSFVNQITDEDVPVEAVAADPLAAAEAILSRPAFPPPPALYGDRRAAPGWELGHAAELDVLLKDRERFHRQQWHSRPLLARGVKALDESGEARTANGDSGDQTEEVVNPARPGDKVGTVQRATAAEIDSAVAAAVTGQHDWAARGPSDRAGCLISAASMLEANPGEVLALLCREAGKTLEDAIAEWRETIDFLRYYSSQATNRAGRETEEQPRGVFVCISPWNFPLAIFTGQIAAALVTGNTVLAKPAEQTPLIASRMVAWLHEAGVPLDVLQLLPGDGDTVGAALCSDPRVAGICFTGSLATAQHIHRAMADHLAPDAPLIAETGGINAMIVDSTALPEQAVEDIVASAFASAGQRCSALRVLYLQEEVADKMLTMLRGAMAELCLGDPWHTDTDVGPVIDGEAREAIEWAVARHEPLLRLNSPEEGLFVAPTLIEVSGIEAVTEEVFGPVLFVARYRARDLGIVLEAINASGYGLTFGMHSRLVHRTEHSVARLKVGNVYLNRNQIGAVVESQPFGGEGLSGTGPKAGGPHYLSAFLEGPMGQRWRNGSPIDPGDKRSSPEISIDELERKFSQLVDHDWLPDLPALLDVLPDPAIDEALELPRQLIMPGPTGERNRYRLAPLERVLCLGPAADQALEQALAVLAFGGAALICLSEAESLQIRTQALQELGAPIALLEGQIATETLTDVKDLQAVCWYGDADHGRELRRALARREGAIVRFITAGSPVARCFLERHVCHDTTRAGGNIELMARVKT